MTEYEKHLHEYIDDLKSDDSKKRITAARILGEWGNDRAVTPLIQCLSHQDENFRRESIVALKEIQNRRAVEPLLKKLLKDSSPEVRAEAAYALAAHTKFDIEIENLLEALNDKHYLVRQNAAFALGKTHRRKAVRFLIASLNEDSNYNVREMAAWALGEINDKRAIEPLIQALNDSHLAVRKNAAFALGRLESKEATEELKKQVFRPDETKDASWALTRILKKKQSISFLKDAFKRLRKEDQIADAIEICRVLIPLDSKTARKYLDDLLADKNIKKYHSLIKSIY